VYIADVLSAKLQLGFTGSVESTEPNPDVLKQINLTPAHIDQVADDLPKAMEEAMGLLQDK
jgi:hypothetical protein